MKIGILTFHRASNYGAVLQAYALTEAIRQYNKNVEIIDYYCPEVEDSHSPKSLFKKQNFLSACIHYYGKSKKYKLFDDFRKRKLTLSKKYNEKTKLSLSDEYDIFISGSDQVWSKKYSGMDLTYLQDFVNDRSRKYSYSASFGFTEFPDDSKEIYEKYLNDFQMVSVRESSAKELVSREIGINAFVSLDPTLLLSQDKWKEFAKYPQNNEKYILIYYVQSPKNLVDYAKKLSAEKNIKIILLNSSLKNYKELKHARFATPEEFVGWFANAEYVLTNSFHGTAFSVIFQKNVVVEIETKQSINTRSLDLLKKCGIESRVLTKDYKNFELSDIDWQIVSDKLNAEKNESLEYLKSFCMDLKGKL